MTITLLFEIMIASALCNVYFCNFGEKRKCLTH